ncbi:MAG TPA: hypothetical protein VH724_00385 [Candidatus Angelobacter sp.]|nr:hypothetical protein [Candidatus Angelobacter sp.]
MTKKLLVAVFLLSAVAAFAAATDANTQSSTASLGTRTYLMPDLSFKSVFVLDDVLPQAVTVAPQPEGVAIPVPKHGTCRCSCGYPCKTSADCGGASCDAFISCCARKDQNPEAEWFTRSFELSSHKTAQSDEVLKEIVKAECK